MHTDRTSLICLDRGKRRLHTPSNACRRQRSGLPRVRELGPLYRRDDGTVVRPGYRDGDCSLRGRVHDRSAKRAEQGQMNCHPESPPR